MRCLHLASKLEPVIDPELDNYEFYPEGYHPNPNGFYQSNDWEVDLPHYFDVNKGRLIKIVRRALHLVPPGRYKLVFMTRAPDEIRASMRRFSPDESWGIAEADTYLYDLLLPATLDRLRRRGDFEILQVSYHDVIDNPLRQFKRIRDFGFPIDDKKAASLVDESLYRVRLEKDGVVRT